MSQDRVEKRKAVKPWIIVTNGERPIRDVARDLAAAGLQSGKILEEIGSITGSAAERDVARLRKVPGVAEVAADEAVDIGPPGSDETW